MDLNKLIRVFIFITVLCSVTILRAGGPVRQFALESFTSDSPAGNEISQIMIQNDTVWVCAGEGLSYTLDNGHSWKTFSVKDHLGRGYPTAINERNGVIWVSTALDTFTGSSGTLEAGGGLSYSTDGGESWHWIPQPIDSVDEDRYEPTTTPVQNLTYDIAQTDSAVWITSYGGGLRKSTDMGSTWQVVTVNGQPFAPLNYLSHRVFSVVYDEDALWVGSADGIHKSRDGGFSWETFNHQNQVRGISGNFVVALASQTWKDKKILWASTIEAVDSSEYRAISKSEDGGQTWEICQKGLWTYHFAIDDSMVYAATDSGLYKSPDFGTTWDKYRYITDSKSGDPLLTEIVYAAGIGPNKEIWMGSADGLTVSEDDGWTWRFMRAYQKTAASDVPDTYAYPNPFSPMRDNQLGNDGYVRFQYHTNGPAMVTVKVYDFALNLVTTVVDNKSRFEAGDYAEAWNGRNDLGQIVANDVYFYCVDINDGRKLWGKVIIMD